MESPHKAHYQDLLKTVCFFG